MKCVRGLANIQAAIFRCVHKRLINGKLVLFVVPFSGSASKETNLRQALLNRQWQTIDQTVIAGELFVICQMSQKFWVWLFVVEIQCWRKCSVSACGSAYKEGLVISWQIERIFEMTYLVLKVPFSSIGVFPKWKGNSVNSANLGDLKNH